MKKYQDSTWPPFNCAVIALLSVAFLFLAGSCQQEIDPPEPNEPNQNDSIYVRELLYTNSGPSDTVLRETFEYDANKRLVKKTIFQHTQPPLPAGVLVKIEYTLSYSGNDPYPERIIMSNTEYLNPGNNSKDTTYMFYKNGFVSKDSSRTHLAGNIHDDVRLYEEVEPGRFRYIYRNYNNLSIVYIDSNYSHNVWMGGNLLEEIDSFFHTFGTPITTVVESKFSYDNKTNPFKRINIPYLLPASGNIGNDELLEHSIFNHGSNNNILTYSTEGNPPSVVVYEYNDLNLPVTATVTDVGWVYKVYYKYTSL